jgi:hypothetical protein
MDILVINKKNYPSLSDRDLEVFYETGILRFAGALRDDPVFHTFLRDLTWTARRLLKRANVEVPFNASLALMLAMLLKAEGGALPRFLNGLCSHPMKLMSGNLLKCDPRLMFVLRKLMGEDAVIAGRGFAPKTPEGQKEGRSAKPVLEEGRPIKPKVGAGTVEES